MGEDGTLESWEYQGGTFTAVGSWLAVGWKKVAELESDKVIYLCSLINKEGIIVKNQDYANSGSVIRYRVSSGMVITGNLQSSLPLSDDWKNILVATDGNKKSRVFSFSEFNSTGITIQEGEKYINISMPCIKGSYLNISWGTTSKTIRLDIDDSIASIDNEINTLSVNYSLIKNVYKDNIYRALDENIVTKKKLEPVNTIKGFISNDGTIYKEEGYGSILIFDGKEYDIIECSIPKNGGESTILISVSDENSGNKKTYPVIKNKDLSNQGEFIKCNGYIYVWVAVSLNYEINGLSVKEKSIASKVDLENLEISTSNKVDIARGGNLFNKDAKGILVDTLLREDGTTYNQTLWSVTDWMPVEELQTYTSNYTPMNALVMLLVYNINREVIQVVKGNGVDVYKVTTLERAAFVRFTFLSEFKDKLIFQKGDVADDIVYQYDYLTNKTANENVWADKILGLLGDSITELNNGSEIDGWALPYQSWGWYLKNKLYFKEIISRGIGGTVLVHRYSSEAHNKQFNEYGQTVSNGIEINYTGMCDWQRIITQFPAIIKDTIDGIILMGGTNDLAQDIPLGDSVEFEGYDGTQLDPNNYDLEWINSEYYNGGDFKITTYIGAVCSAIMKLQAWMPKATIIVATPLSGVADTINNGKNTTERWKNRNGSTSQDYANKAIEAANYMSVPVIDINQLCGINPFNRKFFIADGVHPYAITDGAGVRHNNGNVAMARVFIGELSRILPKFDYIEWQDAELVE